MMCDQLAQFTLSSDDGNRNSFRNICYELLL